MFEKGLGLGAKEFDLNRSHVFVHATSTDSALQMEVPIFPPVFSKGVLDDPVLLPIRIRPEAHQDHRVVGVPVAAFPFQNIVFVKMQ